jgi:tetratricopeptide (TPR) repeat protein
MYSFSLAALLCAASALAQPVSVSIRDAHARELRRAEALVFDSGLVIDRDALRGAFEVALPGGDVTRLLLGEDRDAGLALLWHPSAEVKSTRLMPGEKVRTSAHQTEAEREFDLGSFGPLWRLQTRRDDPEVGRPLFVEDGRWAGWHVARKIDGQLFSFALPAERVRDLRRAGLWRLDEWNAARNEPFEEAYSRAMGYLWIQDFEGAGFYLNKAITAAPRDARARFHRAFVDGKRGRAQDRLAGYRRVIELDPGLAEARYNLAIVCLMANDEATARAQALALRQLVSPLAEKVEGFLGLIHVDTHPAADPHKH